MTFDPIITLGALIDAAAVLGVFLYGLWALHRTSTRYQRMKHRHAHQNGRGFDDD